MKEKEKVKIISDIVKIFSSYDLSYWDAIGILTHLTFMLQSKAQIEKKIDRRQVK